jgi:TonB family protein
MEHVNMLIRNPLQLAHRFTARFLMLSLLAGAASLSWAGDVPAPPAPPKAPAPPAPPAPPAAPADMDVSYRRLAPPQYPADALAERKQGTVLLQLVVDTGGDVDSIEVVRSSGDARLDEAAKSTVMTWTFNPARRSGKAVREQVQVPVQFALDAQTPVQDPPPGALDTITLRGG